LHKQDPFIQNQYAENFSPKIIPNINVKFFNLFHYLYNNLLDINKFVLKFCKLLFLNYWENCCYQVTSKAMFGHLLLGLKVGYDHFKNYKLFIL